MNTTMELPSKDVIATMTVRQYKDGEIRYRLELGSNDVLFKKSGLYARWPINRNKNDMNDLLEVIFANASMRMDKAVSADERPTIRIRETRKFRRSKKDERPYLLIKADIIEGGNH